MAELTAEKTLNPRWIPVIQPGGIYCSPACGGKCKLDAYNEAVKSAAALAARMGEGWKPRVWENLGWHYSVQKGVCQIHAEKNDPRYTPKLEGEFRYAIFLNVRPQVLAEGSDPRKAFAEAVHTALTRIETTMAELCEATGYVPPEENT